MNDNVRPITQLLKAHGAGEPGALDRVVPLLYEELRAIARGQLRRGQKGVSLNTTGLVHELYLKLSNQEQGQWNDRQHFLAASARAMRHLLIDYARGKQREKRGGDLHRTSLDAEAVAVQAHAELLLTLDRALEELADQQPRWVRVFECRYFAGFTERETAEVLGMHLSQAQRDWRRARRWLKGKLQHEGGQGGAEHE